MAGGGVGAGDDAAARAWEAIRADPAIQYAPVEMPETPPPPDWLTELLEWLGELFAPIAGFIVANWSVIWPVLAILGGVLALYVLARLFLPDLVRRARRDEEHAEEWRPEETAALALLEEADRLAAEGQYDEATHLLLTRSVGQIAQARPELLEPSSTAREIAALPLLPDAARAAFAVIAGRVEKSLFALKRLSADDWHTARAAYAEFARVADSRFAA